jgi:predicted permease
MWAYQDLAAALRRLRAQPGFAAAAIVMLALGIGATTAIFSVVKNVLIDPLPYPNAGAVVKIVHNIGGIDQPYFNDAIVVTYLQHTRAFESFGVWTPSAGGVTVTGQGEPEEVLALTATRGLLTTLGVQPELGRWFSSEEDAPGAIDTAMIGGGYWRRKFGRDSQIIGRTIVIDARPHVIVGVMPEHFAFGGDFDVLLPLRLNHARPAPGFRLNGIARMKPGVTLPQANADIARMLEIYFDAFRTNTSRAVRWVPGLLPLEDDVIGDVAPTLWILLAAIALVQMMACANVANLLLVRTEGRRHEFAVRAALGAGWTRIARGLILEHLLLTGAGGVLGLAGAFAALRVLVTFEPANVPRLSEIAIDRNTVLFAVAITAVCGLLFGLLALAKSLGPRLTPVIGVGTRGVSLTRERQRSQSVLVATQLALALVLLVASGLMIRSFHALSTVDPGFVRPDTLQTFAIAIAPAIARDLEQVTRTQQAILDRIAAVPGVESAAFTTRVPMDPSDRWSAALAVEDRPHTEGTTPPNRQVKVVSPGSFETFGTPLVAGRDFTWTDLYELREVAIVSDNLARELWGAPQAALGKRVRQFYGPAGPWREVIGVAGDVHDDGVQQPPPATVNGRRGWTPRSSLAISRAARASSCALRVPETAACSRNCRTSSGRSTRACHWRSPRRWKVSTSSRCRAPPSRS